MAFASDDSVDFYDVLHARERLDGIVFKTPLVHSLPLSERAGTQVFVKCENLQRTGSFKIRGAYNHISCLEQREMSSGVVTASAGNHAQGVALAAALKHAACTVFMPQSASRSKVEGTGQYGAHVCLTGRDFDETCDAALRYASDTGARFVHPFDDAPVIAGQGTIACEIFDDLPDVGTVIAPVGGGGLISGLAVALRTLSPGVRLIGVQARGAASFPPSLQAGHRVRLSRVSTIADGIAVSEPGELTLSLIQRYVDDVVTVTDDETTAAMSFAIEHLKLVLEPAAAAALAPLLGALGHLPGPVVLVASGGNVDSQLLSEVCGLDVTHGASGQDLPRWSRGFRCGEGELHDFHVHLDLARVFWTLDDKRIGAIAMGEAATPTVRELAGYILELKADLRAKVTARGGEQAAITKVAVRLAGMPGRELVGALRSFGSLSSLAADSHLKGDA